MKRILLLSLIILLLLSLEACSGRRTDTAVICAGSTSLQPYVELLSERYKEINAGSNVEVQGGGSSAGITAALDGAADIGMSSRALKETEQVLWSQEIAKDGLAIVIHPNNPLFDLSIEEIRKIYSGEITSWSDLGGNDSKIHIITREEGSGTRSAFEELVMEKVSISPKAIVQDSNGAVRQLVSSDTNSIGYISLGLVDNTMKAIALDGIEATYDNIVSNTYTLHRPFLFVSLRPPKGEALRFIEFVMSEEGQKILTDEGLIPPLE